MEGQYASAYAGARQTYSQGRARLDAIQAVSSLCSWHLLIESIRSAILCCHLALCKLYLETTGLLLLSAPIHECWSAYCLVTHFAAQYQLAHTLR